VAARLAQWVAEEMGLDVRWPLELKTDSMQARSFQHNTTPNSKLRGCFDLRDALFRELRDKKVIESKYIKRTLNIADLMTHSLSRSKFQDMLHRAQHFQTQNCKVGRYTNSILFF